MIILQLKNNLKKKRKDRDFPDGPMAKNPPSDAGHTGSNLFGKLRAHMQWAKFLCYNQREDPAQHQRSCLPQLRLDTAKINIIQYLKKKRQTHQECACTGERPRKDATGRLGICKPRREASGEAKPASTLTWDFSLQNSEKISVSA